MQNDDDWEEDANDDGLMACPYCGEEMYDDSPRCPACGHYLSDENAPPEKKPPWILITAVILLIIFIGLSTNWF